MTAGREFAHLYLVRVALYLPMFLTAAWLRGAL